MVTVIDKATTAYLELAALVDEAYLLYIEAKYNIEITIATLRMRWEAVKFNAMISLVEFIIRLKVNTGWTWF